MREFLIFEVLDDWILGFARRLAEVKKVVAWVYKSALGGDSMFNGRRSPLRERPLGSGKAHDRCL